MQLNFQKNQSLREYSTFAIGGIAEYFTIVRTKDEMKEAFLFAKNESLPVFILGKGSNCLFDDQGFDGLVIQNRIDFCDIKDTHVEVGAGYSFSLLGVQLARTGLTGLEFASGIPATVGGAVYMNAGANGKETCHCLESVCFLTLDGDEKLFYKNDLQFSYRTSSFQKMKGAILSATFLLTPDPEARKNQLALVDYRMRTQPLKDKSAGCVFRNPPNSSAGALIEKSGLKGFQIGGAKVSEKHANFIVNSGGASTQDVLSLISHIKKTVWEKMGVSLEMEIRYIRAKE